VRGGEVQPGVQPAEPRSLHRLWQFTDSFPVPGVGRCDASVFHGTIGQLAALGYGGKPAQNWTEELLATLPTLQQGNRDHPGSVQFVHRMQALIKVVGDVNKLPSASAVAADGNFAAGTSRGLLVVQKFFGLTEDGVCGPKTWTALITGQRA
jgi:peptidoglycan hydrolase-like protein with peptidoglycan-binding domain